MYAVISIPFERRTRAIFRIAEFGLRGVLVVTLVHTPRLNGELYEFGLLMIELNPTVNAPVFVRDTGSRRFLLVN